MLKTFVNFQRTNGEGQVTNTAEIEAWNLKDVTSRNYIFATLTKPMKESLYSCGTAADMWTKLNNQYQLRAADNLHLLWQSFYDFSHLSGDDMTTHLQKLSSIADKLRELGQPMDQMQLVTKALATLPEKFRIVRSVWANIPLEERTMDNLLQRLRSEENVLKSYERNEDASQAAYVAQNRSSTRGNHHCKCGGSSGARPPHRTQDGFVNQRLPREGPRCGYCYIFGHETQECRKKKKAEQEQLEKEPAAF